MQTICSVICGSIALFALGSCASTPSAWRQVDPQRLMITVDGRLEELDLPAEGDVRLTVVPATAHRYALAPGQQRLVCIVPARDREDLATALLNLSVGQNVGVGGYWVARDEAAGTRYYLADTTAVWIID